MKVLLATSNFAEFSSKPLEILEANNFSIIKNPFQRKMTSNEIISLDKEIDAIIAGTEIYDKNLLDKLKSLKIISRVGVGLDNIDFKETKRRGIKIAKNNFSPSLAVSEFTITLILNLLKKINIHSSEIKNNKWSKKPGSLLSNKTIGIVGVGNIGQELIKILSGFNVNFLAFDKFENNDLIKTYNVRYSSLENLFKESDVITIHLPNNEETENLINKNFFSLMKNNSIFVNTSRGEIVNEDDLFDLLTNNKTIFAGIDVFKKEPYIGPLSNLENIILTPHIAAYAKETRIEMEIDAVRNLVNLSES